MQEMNPDTVLEQAAPAADPEPQAVRPAEDTSIPSAPEAPATEAAAPQPEAPVAVSYTHLTLPTKLEV